MTALRRHLPLVLVAAFLSDGATAAPEGSERSLDLSQARIVASPGWPAALEGFLPPGREVERLSLPLPPGGGPLLVLGLWDSDPVARALMEDSFGIDPREGLRGGYRAMAGDFKGRIAVIFAQDAAALAAARFELETFVPNQVEMSERRVDVTQPDAQGGVRMALGRRDVLPAFRHRALGGLAPDEGPLDVAAAHANRLWLDASVPQVRGPRRSTALLAEHGVVPVAETTVWLAQGPDADGRVADAPPDQSLARLLGWQEQGVRHFALTMRALPGTRLDAALARREQALVERFATALRPGGLQELLVVPMASNDEDERRMPAPDLRAIPGALLGWKGPSARPLAVPLEAARRKAARAGVPVVLIETWMHGVLGLPSLPRGRDPRLGEVLHGVVVLGGPGACDVLAGAWSTTDAADPQRDAATILAQAPALDPGADVAEQLVAAAGAIERAGSGRLSDPLWLRQLADRARTAAGNLPPRKALLLARVTSAELAPDGRLDELAWAQAPATFFGPGTARALADGRRVVLGVEFPRAWRTTARLEVTVHAGTGLPRTRRFALALRGCRGEPPPTAFEVALEHYDLGGDPFPTQRCALNLRLLTPHGDFALAPDEGPAGLPMPGGALVVVR